MHVLIVPLVTYTDPGAGDGLRPDLPDSILYARGGANWGQASSDLSNGSVMCVHVSLPASASAGLIADRDTLIARPDVTVLGRSLPNGSGANLRTAMRTGSGTGRDDAIRDFLGAYRATAKAEEDRRRQSIGAMRTARALLPFIAVLGVYGTAKLFRVDDELIAWGLKLLGPAGLAITWNGSPSITEDAERAHNLDMDGVTTTTGSKAWATPTDATSVRVRNATGTDGELAGYDGNHAIGIITGVGLANVRVDADITNTTAFGGPIARVQGSPNYEHYGFDNSGASTSNVRKWTSVTAFTTLASSSQTWNTDDVARLDCDGASLTSYINDVLETGPTTDSSYSSGDVGVRVKSNGGQLDNVAVYEEAVAAERAPLRNQPVHNFRGHVVAASF